MTKMTFSRLSAAIVLALLFISVQNSQAQDLCENGLAAGVYPCENVDLLSIMGTADLGGGTGIEYNDIWGWTDPQDGKEYVIIGRTDGSSFVDISDPLNPVFLGFLPTHTSNSIWRDVKVNGNYAYIVSEANNHGMQIFDLTRLRNVANPPETFTSDAHYANFGRAHNVVINEGVDRAYGVGTNTFSGGMHIVDISDPLNPTILGDFSSDGYTHDAQVVTYNGPDAAYVGKQIAFNCNENTLTIVDVDDPLDCTQIGRVGYPNIGYSHQGWLTEDHRYFLLGDELDEINQGINTRTVIWDVQDLANPVVIGQFFSDIAAIDHNLYTRGNLVYQANYRGGLRILDMTNIAAGTLNEVASFDLYPASNSAAFNGAWSSYPYFASGVVAVSHIEEGLFLLQPSFFRAEATESNPCIEGNTDINLTVVDGFAGPVNFSITGGLPSGTNASFSQNGVGAGNYVLSLSNLPASPQVIELELTAEGASYTYTASVSLNLIDCANIVPGCTDPAAENFDPAATVDDGSCTYACEDVTLTISTDCWGSEVSWNITDDQGNIIASVPEATYGNEQTFTWEGCLPAGCYTFNIFDGFGDGMFGSQYGSCTTDGNYFMTDSSGNVLFQMADPNYGAGTSEAFCITPPPCIGDFDNDGLRTVADVLVVLGQFGCNVNCTADLDGDNIIGSTDVLVILSFFGTACP